MIKILISSCLLGEPVRYNGQPAKPENLIKPGQQGLKGKLISFCPECAGGLSVPRQRSEIVGGDGLSVIEGYGKVLQHDGVEVTENFISGAKKALQIADRQRIPMAILADGSPSCGCTFIYDGTFSKTTRPGKGVTAALLKKKGLAVFAGSQFNEAVKWLEQHLISLT